MNQKIVFGLVVASFVLGGCGAQLNKSSSGPADPSRAYDSETGECDPYKSTREDYGACKRAVDSANAEIKKTKAATTPTPAPTATSVAAAPQPTTASPPPVAPAPQPTMVASAPPPVASTAPQSTLYVVPTAVGPVCKAPIGTGVSITNDTSTPVRMMSSDVAPLTCDAPYSLSPACVANADGSHTCTAIIPVGVTAQFVLVYRLTGLIPQIAEYVRMVFTAHVNLGPMFLAPQTGKAVSRGFKPAAFPTGATIRLVDGDFIGS